MLGMPYSLARPLLGLACLMLLAGCESSSRLGSLLPDSRLTQETLAAPPPLTPAPSSPVETSALPPPPGSGPGVWTQAPHASTGVGTAPGNLPASSNPPPRVATAPAPVLSRTSVTGSWTLSESTGTRCRITLSSASKLDLYAASTSGCQSKDLQKINAWELNGTEIILYEPGGAVNARLRQSGDQSFAGAAARSGAPLSLSK
jgi:Protease inhibitor Inh